MKRLNIFWVLFLCCASLFAQQTKVDLGGQGSGVTNVVNGGSATSSTLTGFLRGGNPFSAVAPVGTKCYPYQGSGGVGCDSGGSGGGAVASVSNSDGTLNISPTTGAVVAALNLAHANTWTAGQTFNAGGTIPSGATFTIASGGTLNCASGSTCPGANATLPLAVSSGVMTFAASILNSAYGGNGNGSTDNSAAFTADCSANGQVYLPAGGFALTSSYTIPCPVVFGAGASIVALNAVTVTMNYPPIAPPIQIFTLSGTGTVAQNTQGTYAYPEWWGVTGTADDVALNYCTASIHTGACRLSQKVYHTTASVNLANNGVGLEGQGNEFGTEILSNSSSANVVTISADYNFVKNLAVARSVAATAGASGISISGVSLVSNSIIENVESLDSPNGFLLQSTPGNTYLKKATAVYTSVSSTSVTQYGFNLNGPMNSTTIQDSFVLNTVGASLHVWGSYSHGAGVNDLWTVNFGCTSTDHCNYVDGSGATTNFGADDIHFINTIADQQYFQSIYVTALAAANGAALDVDGGYFLTYGTNNVPTIDIESSNGVTLRGPSIPNGSGAQKGILINGGGGNSVTSAMVRTGSGSGTYGIDLNATVNNTVSGNQIALASNTVVGIELTNGANHNTITGNQAKGSSSGTGLYTDSTSNFNQFSANDMSAFTTAYSDSGASNLWNGVPNYATLTDGATITWALIPFATSNNAKVTLGGNRTLAISGVQSGGSGTLEVVQDATGSRTLTLPAGSKVINGGGGACTLSTAANDIDVLTFTYDGSHYLWTCGLNFN